MLKKWGADGAAFSKNNYLLLRRLSIGCMKRWKKIVLYLTGKISYRSTRMTADQTTYQFKKKLDINLKKKI